jgi:hypothetical protein
MKVTRRPIVQPPAVRENFIRSYDQAQSPRSKKAMTPQDELTLDLLKQAALAWLAVLFFYLVYGA